MRFFTYDFLELRVLREVKACHDAGEHADSVRESGLGQDGLPKVLVSITLQ